MKRQSRNEVEVEDKMEGMELGRSRSFRDLFFFNRLRPEAHTVLWANAHGKTQ